MLILSKLAHDKKNCYLVLSKCKHMYAVHKSVCETLSQFQNLHHLLKNCFTCIIIYYFTVSDRKIIVSDFFFLQNMLAYPLIIG